MEGKKKFEKPELRVVEMKLAGVTCGSSCPEEQSSCPEEHQYGCFFEDED